MKPRLKVTLAGRLQVVELGDNQWTHEQARECVKRHYGNVGKFAARWGFKSDAAYLAFRTYDRAGAVAELRTVLGLPVGQPSRGAIALARHHALRRAGASRGGAA